MNQLSSLNPLNFRKKNYKGKAYFALALVCFFWGTTWIASREGVRYMPAIQMAGIRQFLGGACYVIFFLSKGAPLPKGKQWIPVIMLSILNFALTNGLSTLGVKYISAGLASIISAIFPLWLVVIGFFTSEKIPLKAIAGLLLGFGGVCIIFYDHLQDFLIPDFRWGIILSLIASWTWAFGTLYTKKLAGQFNPYFSLGLQMVISGVFLSLFSSAMHQSVSIATIPWQSWAAIGYLVIFGSVISFIAYLYALQNLSTQEASLYAYINPVVTVIISSLFFDDKLTIFISIGGIVALAGVYIVNRAYKASMPAPEQPEPEGI